MAGHSQFKNIMHRKGAQDAKRAKTFARIAREITVAVKSGNDDPKQNPRLRNAIINARSENMPNDKIKNAIQKGTSGESLNNLFEIRYEGYGYKWWLYKDGRYSARGAFGQAIFIDPRAKLVIAAQGNSKVASRGEHHHQLLAALMAISSYFRSL